MEVDDNDSDITDVNDYSDNDNDNEDDADTYEITDDNIDYLVNLYLNDKNNLPPALRNIPIGDWDVSHVEDMGYLFSGRDFNEPLDNWVVSNVTIMTNMFQGCIRFNQPLNNWDVSNVKIMSNMFQGCWAFDQPLDNWHVDNVESMAYMFDGCSVFNQPLNNWNVHKVKNMLAMFTDCYKFNQPLDTWDINNVENMAFMFLYCRNFNQSLNNWTLGTNVRTEDMFLLSGISEENKPVLKEDEVDPLLDKIEVFNILLPGNESAAEFLEDNKMYQPFVVRNRAGLFTGDAILWPAPSSSGKEFIECKDDTPVDWRGNSYGQYIKPNGRTFIKVMISGSPTMVVKPDWYDEKRVPGTKFFQLVDTNAPVFKFMTTVLASGNWPADFTAVGSDHCNQTSPVGVYQLEPISVEQLTQYATTSGGRKKQIKTRKTRKQIKTRKIIKINKRKTRKLRKGTKPIKRRKTNRRKTRKLRKTIKIRKMYHD